MNNLVNIFCYGSLMYPEVWNLIVKGKYQQQQAKISGYRRKKLKNEAYPGLIAALPEDTVEGNVYFSITDEDLTRLDMFEGELYTRIKVKCFLVNNTSIEAFAYLIHPQKQTVLEPEDWNQQEFETNDLTKFLNEYQGFVTF